MEFVEFNGEEFTRSMAETKPMASHCVRVKDIREVVGGDGFWILAFYEPHMTPFKLNKFNRDKLVAKLTGAS